MKSNIYEEKWIKRWLKKTVSITLSVMVGVMITGGIAYGEPTKTTEEEITELKAEVANLKLQLQSMGTSRSAASGSHYISTNGDVGRENYNNDGATGQNSIAIGVGALANGESGTAIGNKARGTEKSVAIGLNATTHQDRVEEPLSGGGSIVIAEEYDSKSSVAIGESAFARADKSIAIGKDSEAGFLGYIAQANKQIPGIAIGSGATANSSYADARGNSKLKSSGLAIGVDAKATGSGPGIAIGDDAFVGNIGAIALGSGAKAYLGDTDTNKLEVVSPEAIAIGHDALVKGRNSIAIGADSGVYEKIGKANSGSSTPAETNAVALGYHSKVERRGSVALGAWSETRRVSLPGLDESRYATNGDFGSNVIIAPFSNAKLKFYDLMNGANYNDTKNTDTLKKLAVNGVVSVGGVYSDGGRTVSFGRQIINVADGTEDTDAVNLRQLKGAVDGIGTHFVSVKGDSTLGNYNNNGATANKSVAIGTNARAGGEGATAVGNNAYAETKSGIAIGENVYATDQGPKKIWGMTVPNSTVPNPASGIGIGKNIFVNESSIDIGMKSPDVKMGKYTGTNTITNRRASTTVGTESYSAAHYATILGAYSRINTNPEKKTSFLSPVATQGFASAITGSLNKMNVDDDKNAFDGVANVINGTSNIINHANGAVILGAGNTITNSMRKLSGSFLTDYNLSPENMNSAIQNNRDTLGSVGILGGGNKAENTVYANIQGVKNVVENSEHIGTNGSYNKINNAEKAVVIGNGIVLQGTEKDKAEKNIVSGFYDDFDIDNSKMFKAVQKEVNGETLSGYAHINDENTTYLKAQNGKYYSGKLLDDVVYNDGEYYKSTDVAPYTYIESGEYVFENNRLKKVEHDSSGYKIDGVAVQDDDPRLAQKKEYVKGYYDLSGSQAQLQNIKVVANIAPPSYIKGSAKDIVAIGNNITAQTNNSVYLGADSSDGYVDNQANKDAGHKVTTAGMGAYSSFTIGETRYGNFAGAEPKGIVSVGAPDKERRIENVAAGLISEDSTDAINGSQLYSVMQKLEKVGGELKYAGDKYDEGLSSSDSKIDLETGTLTVAGGTDSNISTVAKANGTIEVDLKDTIHVGKGANKVTIGGTDGTVETGNVVINKDGATINKGTNNEIVMNSDGITVGKAGNKVEIDGNTGTVKAGDVTISNDKITVGSGNKVTINGSKGNVENLTNINWNPDDIKLDRAATEGQLKEIVTTLSASGGGKVVVKGTGAAIVTSKTNEDGHQEYDVHVDRIMQYVDGEGRDVIKDGNRFYLIKNGQIDRSKQIAQSDIQVRMVNPDGTTTTPTKLGNVADGKVAPGSKDAVNGGQLYDTQQMIAKRNEAIDQNARAISDLRREHKNGMAQMAAMTAVDFAHVTPHKLKVGAAVGAYKGARAVAVGVAYAPTEHFLLDAKWSTPTTTHRGSAVGIGATYEFNCD